MGSNSPGDRTKVRKTRKNNATKQCHPRVKNGENGCLPVTVLEKAAKKLGVHREGNILEKVAKAVKVDPENQNSVLKALPLSDKEKEQLARRWLRPERPSSWANDPDMWLDTNNIRDVMTQYEESHPKFKFLGAVPIDFAAADPYTKKKQCLINEICELDMDGDSMKGKDHVGFVFNLDPHYKPGSHWVASFLDIPKKQYYYFDSYGMRPPPQIYKFMQWLTIQEPELVLKMNARRFQRKESECGMFCIDFIVNMLEGKSFEEYCRSTPSDRDMLLKRKEVFSQ
jgi:hypothetical protein